MCDQAKKNYNKGVSRLRNVELDIQEEKEVSSQYKECVCGCVCLKYGKRKYEITKHLKGVT